MKHNRGEKKVMCQTQKNLQDRGGGEKIQKNHDFFSMCFFFKVNINKLCDFSLVICIAIYCVYMLHFNKIKIKYLSKLKKLINNNFKIILKSTSLFKTFFFVEIFQIV